MWTKAQSCLEDGAKFGAAQVKISKRGVANNTAVETQPDEARLQGLV